MSDDARPEPAPGPPAPGAAPPTLAPRGGPLVALWHLLQPVLGMALLLAAMVAAVGGVSVWLLRSPEGTAWLLARVPVLEVHGVQGALLSDRFGVERAVVRWDGGKQSVTIEGLQGEGLGWTWHPARGAWLGLDAQSLRARRVIVDTGPPGKRPIQMARTLQLPLRLNAARVDVDELLIDKLPLRDVHGQRVHLWEPGGREYHAEAVQLVWDRALVEGHVSFGAQAPYTLQAQARLTARPAEGAASGAAPAWVADARVQGPLARFELQVALQGHGVGNGPAPALDVDASITPLEAWALARLRLRTQALDLASLATGWPHTQLSGRADIDTRSRGGPLAAEVQLDNDKPGRWNEGRLPLRHAQARLRSPDADRRRLLLEDVDLQFADSREAAGRWRGGGQWVGPQLKVDSRIDDLRPHLVDGRAAVMTLSGPLAFTLSGLPAPDQVAGGAAALDMQALAAEIKTTLDGRIEGSPHPLQVSLDGSVAAQRLELRQLRAQAGGALAALTLDAQRGRTGAWQLRSTGQLGDFDPLPWWPGPEGSAWRAGGHRVSGNWALDVQLPRWNPQQPLLQLAQGLAGNGSVRLERSQLAGVPVALQLDLGQRAGTGATASTVRAEATLGGNQLRLEGQGNPLGEGHADRMRLELQAENLATLAPLARLLPELAPWAPRGGRADARIDFAGRWPDARSEGQLTAQALQLGTLSARQVQANWRFDTANDQPMLVQAEAQGVQQGSQQLDALRADLRGTWRQHRVALQAALPAGPPRALEVLLGLRTGKGTLAQLQADGQWDGDGRGGGRWAGRLTQLSLGPWAGAGLPAADAPAAPGAWVDSRDLRAELRVDPKDGLTEVLTTAGQARLAEAITLRWDEVRVDLRGNAPAFALRADLEPFALAPLLARAQPTLGWTGDLRLAARVDLKAAETLDADIVFERRDGDLRVTEDGATRAFGLNEVRLVGSAHGGNWQLAGAFAGKALGEASARLTLKPRPEQRWPTADTPIDGVIEARVANLGDWGNWVPPGWRLSGSLTTTAQVTGRVGEPDYTGEVRAGDVAVRNLLEGVDVRDGQALVRLQGSEATIEQFTLKGGDGTLRVSGKAKLTGDWPAQVRLQAERFRVLGRVDRRITASGAVDVVLGTRSLRAEGKVHVDEGLFDLSRSDAPSLDEDVSIRQGQPVEPSPDAAPAPERPRWAVQLAIDADLGDKLRVRGRGIDTTLSGNVRMGTAAGRLTAHGLVNGSGGTFAAYGQKLDIERAFITFSGEYNNPSLDILALRPNLDTQVGVAITGTALSPRVRLYSSADMSESDKLSWLVLGRASDGLGRADTALLQRAAIALMAGEGEAPTDRLLRNLGLDQLSVRQSDTDVRETVISLGKQLSRRWYVGYERGVNATTGTWQLIYRIAQRFTLRAQSGQENSLDLIWVWRLEAPPPAEAAVPKSAASAPP